MLLRFKISNFLSFMVPVEFSMEASPIKEYVDSNTFYSSVLNNSVLKGGVLYGSNSAGKSNLIKAINFVRRFVLNSSKNLQATDSIDVDPFKLNTSKLDKPSTFEIEFIESNKRYRYYFEANNSNILIEELFEILKTKERPLFRRVGVEIELFEEFESKEQLKELTRKNALFLSVAAQFNVLTAISIIKWFQEIIFIDDMNFLSYMNETIRIIEDPKRKKVLLKILDYAKLGIDDVSSEKFTIDDKILNSFPVEFKKLFNSKNLDGMRILTKHTQYDIDGNAVGSVNFDLAKEESLGTQKYFALAGFVLDSLENGKLIFIDELDARLHPLLCTLIVKLYNTKKTNPKNAQLIFSTQNTNLMSEKLLRRDQIFIVKKNEIGASELNTLHQLKVRNDASFEKEYLEGEYDGVPFKKLPIQLELFE